MSRYCKQDNGGTLLSAIEHQQAVAAKTTGILKLRDLTDWESFRPLLEELTGYATRDWSKGGKPPFDPVFMFKVLVLQKYHDLSDDATEEQIFDRTSFKSFLGLRIRDELPDAKTIWDFKQRIAADDREGVRRLFEAFGENLENKGLFAREGSIVNASFVDAPRQRNHRDQNRRIKNGERPEEFDENPAIGRQKDTAVLADSAYHSGAHEACLLKMNAQDFLMRKATRHHPLPAEEAERNHRVSRIRVRVERVFGRMSQMGAHVCRSIGLKRAKSHNHISNLVYHMNGYACLRK